MYSTQIVLANWILPDRVTLSLKYLWLSQFLHGPGSKHKHDHVDRGSNLQSDDV